MVDFTDLKSVIDGNTNFIITAHQNPDADALGSEMGFKAFLESLGKTVSVVNSDPTPANLSYLDPDGTVMVSDDISELPAYDIILPLDTAVATRFPGLAQFTDENTVYYAIDHHIPGPDNLPGYIDINASSTGEIIYRFITSAGYKLTPETAAPLLYAIGGDTGWLQFANTTPEVVKIMAELSRTADLPFNEAYARMHYNWSEERFRLYLDIMNTLHTENNVAVIHCEQDFLDNYQSIHSISEISDNLINDLKRIKDCPVSIFLKQKSELDGYRVSLRSTDNTDVQKIAIKFGGGGHRAASGCTITGLSLDETIGALLREIRSAE